jgi:amino acid adenylation domain-containing protein
MEHFHLTTPQQNIWNLQEYYADTAISNICGAVFYKEKRDSLLLKQSVCQFIENQSGIRLRFCMENQTMQYVSEKADEEICIMEFASVEELDKYAVKMAGEPMELVNSSMYHFVVFQAGNTSGILAVLSHLISDAWTFGLMAKQVDENYRRLSNGLKMLSEKEDYRYYIYAEAEYRKSNRYAKDKAYWEEKYAVRPEESTMKMSSALSEAVTAERITKAIPLALEEKINEYCQSNNVTQAVLFEMALVIYLSKINSENRSVTIGVPVLNRSSLKEKNTAGMFISTMPLTVTLTKNITITELAEQITKEHMELFRHQKYPYAEILKSIREKFQLSGNLYNVMISYQNVRTNITADTKWYSNGYSEVPFAVHIDNRDANNSHTITVDYQTSVFNCKEVEYIIERLEYVLWQITEDSKKLITDVDIVPQNELKKIIEEFNDTYVEYPKDKCVHELFSKQAEKTPEKTALVFEDKKFSYRQLDEMANSLAHFLREKGVKPNDVVPIIARRSWHVIVAMLGVLKAGGAYMPVSPNYPVDRITDMIETAESKIVLSYGYEQKLNANVELIRLDNFDFKDNISDIENINRQEDSAYVISTSGSTGTPKGITVCHRNVVNYSYNNEKNNVCHSVMENQNERIVSVTNIVFDIFVTESVLPLLNGMCVYFANDDEVSIQRKLAVLIEKNDIEVIQTTPTKMRSYLLDRENVGYLRKIKTIILGGEAFPLDLYHELRKNTNARIYNIYGPAETTVWSTNSEVTDDTITIGKPIANTQIYILDSGNNPLPIGVAGELCIAGEGVGKGYLNRPELTAERFVKNPFATKENHHGKVMYHTGDLARWRADGEIEYLGRIDTQVKLRGLRIELGEIESVMSSFTGNQSYRRDRQER